TRSAIDGATRFTGGGAMQTECAKSRLCVVGSVLLAGMTAGCAAKSPIDAPPPAMARTGPAVRDFSDRDLTRDTLLEVLAPRGVRDIERPGGTARAAKPRCSYYRQRRKGIEPIQPVSDV